MRSSDIIIRIAEKNDFDEIQALKGETLLNNPKSAAYRAHVIIAEEDSDFRGYLLYGMYKDVIPFMHKLYIVPDLRSKGYAGEIISKWEALMRESGFKRAMLTTSSLNTAQNFYRLMGYRDIGSLTLPGDALEMILLKELSE